MERWYRSATEDHNDPGEFSAVSAVPSACYDTGSEDDDQGVSW